MAKIGFFKKVLYAAVIAMFIFIVMGIFSMQGIEFFSEDAFSGIGLFILTLMVLAEVLVGAFGR